MTSTPNSSFDNIENRNGKTAHNAIGKRRSKRISQRTPVPLTVSLFLNLYIYNSIMFFLDDSTSDRRNGRDLVLSSITLVNLFLFYYVCLCVFIRNDVRYTILSIIKRNIIQ